MKAQLIFSSPKGREVILAEYNRILQRWPLPYREHHIPTRWGETFALDCGDPAAPPLVLLHGSVSNSAMWVGDAGIFAARYRVIAVDMPGEPGKSEAVRFDLDGPACAEWLMDVLDALNLEHITLLGISLGGWNALKFATTFPERVEKLVLLCPAGVSPEKMDFFLRALPYAFLGERGTDRIMRMLNAGQPMHSEAVHFSYLISRNFHPRRHGGPLFSDQALGRLTMPVLLLAGDKDILLDSFATAARLQMLLPRLSSEILTGQGHVLVNLAERIMAFLTVEEAAAHRETRLRIPAGAEE